MYYSKQELISAVIFILNAFNTDCFEPPNFLRFKHFINT